ncbi:MAG: type II toxin-antitoxin system VapC family toxin [bacterium]|nr:type II toxin-antitoxin system VapC family toxin [bacterium]
MLLLDTDILVDIQRGYQPAVDWFTQLHELPSVPGYVVMEMIQDAENKLQVLRALKLTRPLPVAWPSAADCDRALSDFQAFHLSHSLGLLDSLIGACAVGRSATLCTYNVKHYRVIKSLKTEQPYPR